MNESGWRPTGSLANGNRLKLGLFALNLERGGSISQIEGTLPSDWPTVERIARSADALGLELLVPVARWRGFGGDTNFAGSCFDTLCFAAGLGMATRNIGVWSTCHVPTIHPIVAAKQLATIDHVSRGRSGLNIVGGWFRPELEMFGRPQLEHDSRYEMAEEWTEIVTALWRDERVDFKGDYFTVVDAMSDPKPLQSPRPPVMNAGGSARGQDFAAKYADLAFVLVPNDDFTGMRDTVERYKATARERYNKDLAVWTQVTVTVCASDAEAAALEAEVLALADHEAVENMMFFMGVETGFLPPEVVRPIKNRLITGWGGSQLTGSPETVAARLQELSATGLDGCLLTFPRWESGLALFGERVIPLLEQANLRKPYDADATAARFL
jgi:FMNH2-dependent dimethyl sulfone monooxygenase